MLQSTEVNPVLFCVGPQCTPLFPTELRAKTQPGHALRFSGGERDGGTLRVISPCAFYSSPSFAPKHNQAMRLDLAGGGLRVVSPCAP